MLGVSTADSCIFDGSPVLVNPVTFQALCAEYELQHFSTDHPAELLAVRVLQSKTVTMSTFAELIPLLPAEVPARDQASDSRIHTFTTGAYVRGGIHGPRCNLTNFPATSTLLAIVLRCACPEATFTSLALLCNQDAFLHRDLNNALESLNFAMALSSFEGGGIWVEGLGDAPPPKPSPDQRIGPGAVLNLAQGPVSFDSHKWHCTMPWVGERRLLVGFTVKGYSDFPLTLVQSLQAAAFALPSTSQLMFSCTNPRLPTLCCWSSSRGSVG